MPVEFLSDEQVASFGRIPEAPAPEELERFFWLSDADHERLAERRHDSTRLSYALQLGTVRFLGAFLPDPLDVPWPVVEFVAGQLGIADPSCVRTYCSRPLTAYEHQWEIRRLYGYRDYTESAPELRRFLEARAWLSNEGPRALFDRAVAWCMEAKVLLPGVTTLARMAAEVRAAASERLWSSVYDTAGDGVRRRLDALLVVPDGARVSPLEALRSGPVRISAAEMGRALERLAAIAELGTAGLDLSGAPTGRLAALARYRIAASAAALRQLGVTRRTATLVATVRQLQTAAADDALDLFELLYHQGGRPRWPGGGKGAAEGPASLGPGVRPAGRRGRGAARRGLRDDGGGAVGGDRGEGGPRRAGPVGRRRGRAGARRRGRRGDEAGGAGAPLRHAALVLDAFVAVLLLDANEAGRPVLAAVRLLPALFARKKLTPADVDVGLLAGSWRRLTLGAADGEAVSVDKRAYTLAVAEQLHLALRRRDVFVAGSGRWGDPRAKLLDGEEWAAKRAEVLEALRLPSEPDQHLAELARSLDEAYRGVAARLPNNPAVSFDDDGELQLQRLTAQGEPASLVELRRLTDPCCPPWTCPSCSWRSTPGRGSSAPTPTSRRPPPASTTSTSRWRRACWPRPAT